MKFNRDKRLLFYQLFKPFAIFVLAVALLACVFMYTYVLHSAYEELDNQLSGAIHSAADLIDTQFEEMGRIVYRLDLEEDIRPYHVFQNVFVHRYASDVLSSYVCANSYLDDVLVYYGTASPRSTAASPSSCPDSVCGTSRPCGTTSTGSPTWTTRR